MRLSILVMTLACATLCVSDAGAQLLFTNFGADVAVYGHEVLVGEPNSRYRPGIVYVFTKEDGGQWTEHKQLTAPRPSNYDGFGGSLDVSGDRLIVGANRQNDGIGAAYIFEHRSGEGWIRVAELTGVDIDAEDAFGASVALEGDLAAVGAPGRVTYGPPGHPRRAGSVFVYRRSGDDWQQVARLTGSGAGDASAFGHRIAIADGRVIVGAPGVNQHSGAAFVFAEQDDAWAEVAMLTGSGAGNGSEFGASVGGRAAEVYVGAPGLGGSGAVFAFAPDETGKSWTQTRVLKPFDGAVGASFGASIDVPPTGALWIGAPAVDHLRGAVYEIRRHQQSEAWLGASIVTAEGGAASDYFGGAVAAADDIAAVASLGADGMTGTTTIFEKTDGGWMEAGVVRSAPVSLPAVTGGQRTCSEGEAGVFGCSGVDLVSFLPIEELGGERGIWVNDLWGWTDPETGTEYVLLGRTNGLAFVDISDPANPVYVGELPKTEGSMSAVWRDVKVYEDHAFVVADNAGKHGVQVFDLRQLRDAGEVPTTFAETARYDGINSAHNIVINTDTGFAYTTGNSGGGETCGGGLHMINIQDPTHPTFAGCFSHSGTGFQGTGYTHDAQCVLYRGPDSDYAGREICFSANENALSIGDVTDKENVIYIASGGYPNSAYVHQGWLDEDHRYFYINDEGDEVAGLVDQTRTLVWDVSDLDDPQLAKEYTWGERASDHNLYIHGDLMYQSNYVSGLRVHDISDPVNPKEIGFFDTVPAGDNGPGFAGSWSNYPYFESEVIAVSSMGEGLFLLKKQSEPGL